MDNCHALEQAELDLLNLLQTIHDRDLSYWQIFMILHLYVIPKLLLKVQAEQCLK